MKNSLYRVTVQPPPAPSVVEELFYNGGILMGARANVAPPGAAVTNGEIVAVYEGTSRGYSMLQGDRDRRLQLHRAQLRHREPEGAAQHHLAAGRPPCRKGSNSAQEGKRNVSGG